MSGLRHRTASSPAGTPRRLALITALTAAVFLVGAAIAVACTVYYGKLRVWDGTNDVTMVGHTGDTLLGETDFMNRCEDASGHTWDDSGGTTPTAYNGIGDSTGPENIYLEVSDYEGSTDCGGSWDSLDPGETYYVNVWDDETSAYEDKDGDKVYEDKPTGDERVYNCMGDGSGTQDEDGDGDDDVINKVSGIEVLGDTDGDGDGDNDDGEFDKSNSAVGDQDNNDVGDVEVTIDTATDASTAAAGCLSDDDESDGWMFPLIIK